MTGGAAVSVATKSGTNEIRGSAFYFRNQDEFNARQSVLLGGRQPAVVSVDILGGTVGGPIKKNHLFYFGGWERNLEKNSRIETFTVPTAKMRAGDFSEVLAVNPTLPPVRPGDRQPVDRRRTVRSSPGALIPANRISSIAQTIQSQYPLPNVAGTNNGTQNNYEVARFPEADARQLRLQGQLEPHLGQPDLGQVLDDGRLGAGPLLHAVRPRPAAATRP